MSPDQLAETYGLVCFEPMRFFWGMMMVALVSFFLAYFAGWAAWGIELRRLKEQARKEQ